MLNITLTEVKKLTNLKPFLYWDFHGAEFRHVGLYISGSLTTLNNSVNFLSRESKLVKFE